MTREEAVKYLIKPVATSTEIGEEKQKEFEAYNIAIEALSAVCDDCIWHVCNYNKVDWDAPSAEAEWIPCSERLPDVDIEVLTTTDWSDVLIAWIGKGGAWETEEHILDNDEILAWMPLPEPYKGGDK